MNRRLLAVSLMCMALAWDAYGAEAAALVTQPSTLARGGRGTRGGASTQPTGVLVEEKGFSYYLDISQAPELKEWAEGKLKADIAKWYPIWVECLASDGYTAPKLFSITLAPNYGGVAATGGTRVTGNSTWFAGQLRNPTWNEASGAILHELVHVVQQYRGRGNPGWLVEGLTDYMRWFHYEPLEQRPKLPNPQTSSYTNSYRVTAAFLEYVVKNVNHELVIRLNAAMRQGRYTPEIWTELTGKTVDELWADYVKWAVESGNVAPARGGGRGGRGRGATTQSGGAGGL